jgi:DNA transformation protein
MPKPENEFAKHCAELLSPLGTVRSTRMFGGHGLYVDELFIAIISAERLYLKADEQTRTQFEAAGCEPFTYEARGKLNVVRYYTPPDETLESPALMRPWARLALEAAVRARAASKPKPKAALKPRAASPAAKKTAAKNKAAAATS